MFMHIVDAVSGTRLGFDTDSAISYSATKKPQTDHLEVLIYLAAGERPHMVHFMLHIDQMEEFFTKLEHVLDHPLVAAKV